jgi:hypothetical protein
MVTEPLPLPDVWLRVSQLIFSLSVQLRVPPPVLVMFKVWEDGLEPPCVAAKEKLVGLAPIAGGVELGGV